jgi:hypothetical protein
MVKHHCIPLESPDEWKDVLKDVEHAFAHTWESCYAMHLTTGFKTYLYCFEAEKIRILCPISERSLYGYTDIVTPYGFSGFTGNGDCPEFPAYWKEFVKQRGYICGYIALNPIFENGTYFDSDEAYQPNSLYFLDLTLSLDDLFANLDRNRKRQLRDWEHKRSGFIFDRTILTQFFLTHYHDFVRRLNATPANYFLKETLAFLCRLSNVFMVGVGEPDRIEAVYIFSYTKYAGDCLFNVPLSQGRAHAAALLWCGVNHLKSLRIPILNLGGGVREGDSVAQSKQRFGSRRISFKCLKQVYEPETFERLSRRANADPNNRVGYFPPYRKA